MVMIYKSDSIRLNSTQRINVSNKFAPRTQAHDLRVIELIGPRGGRIGFAIQLPFGSSTGFSRTSRSKSESKIDETLKYLLERGWTTDKKIADAGSEQQVADREAGKLKFRNGAK